MVSQQKLANDQRRIGLTGGIASGKTTIANFIGSLKNIDLLDADDFSRQLISSGTKSYNTILSEFGHSIIDKKSPSKEIDRRKLKEIIFAYAQKRIWLENLLHPLIKEKMINQCLSLKHKKVLILIVPLLFEAKFYDLCTEIWIVECSKEVRIKRLVERDKISEKQAERIINIQLDLSKEKNKNYILLNNEKDKTLWQNQIEKLI